MADNVIIVGVKRGNERVPSSEISQACGRAGRKHDGSTSQANIIIEDEYFDEIVADMEGDASFHVKSHMGEAEELAFHVLPDICEGVVTNIKELELWYSKTLGAVQGSKEHFDRAIGILIDSEAIENTSEGFMGTNMGKIATKLYFNPEDIKAWRDNFSTLFDMGIENDDLAVAWALGNTPITRMSGDFGKHWEVVSECKNNIPIGLDINKGSMVTIVLWWSAIGGPSVGKMRNQMLKLRDDFGRIHKVLSLLDQDVMFWDKEDFFNELKNRVYRGIPSFLSDLCKIQGITKSRAEYLYNMGVRDRSDIKDMVDGLEGEIDDGFFQVLKAIS